MRRIAEIRSVEPSPRLVCCLKKILVRMGCNLLDGLPPGTGPKIQGGGVLISLLDYKTCLPSVQQLSKLQAPGSVGCP